MQDVDATRERLCAMRSLAVVRDREALDQQVQRLRKANALSPEYLHALTDAVAHEAYGTVTALVASLLAGPAQGLTPVGREASAGSEASLQAEVAALEEQLAQREEEEAELQRAIHAFRARYRNELGPLVSTLLRLRKDRAERSLYTNRASRSRRTAFNQADAQFEQFQSVLEETESASSAELSKEQHAQLKTLFRRASKQCHPDMVAPSMEDEARTYFNALREAYQQNDVERVKEIAQTLEDTGFAQRTAQEAPRTSHLEAKAERLRRRIASVESTIDDLRSTEAYQAITGTDDLDAYFEGLKQKLRREIRQLRRGQRVT